MRNILKFCLIAFTIPSMAYSDYEFSKGGIKAVSPDNKTFNVTKIFFSGKIDNSGTTALGCILENEKPAVVFVDPKNTIIGDILYFREKINDMCCGDVFGSRARNIVAIGDKDVYVYEISRDKKLKPVITRPLYLPGEYDLKSKEESKGWEQLPSIKKLKGRVIAAGDVNNDNKDEILLVKDDVWTMYRSTTTIYQILQWTGKEFQTILINDGNYNLGIEGGIYIEDVNFDAYKECLFFNRVFQFKGREVSISHNGITAIGKLGEDRVLAICGLERTVKDDISTGAVSIVKLDKKSFPALRDKSSKEFILTQESFDRKGKYKPDYTSTETITNYKRMVFADIDGDGKNELVINCETEFFVVKSIKKK